MLQAIRDKAGSLIVKILFLLLIATFGMWGIGDVFRNRGGDTMVAKVGDIEIRAAELQTQVRDDLNRLRSTLGSIDMEQAKQLGLIDTTLNRMISRDLVELEAQRLRLDVGDEEIRKAIQSDPVFHNSAGVFDRGVYNRILADNRLTEVQYEQRLRHDLMRDHLLNAMVAGVIAPKGLVDALYRMRNEKRRADLVFLPLDTAGDVGEPSEQDIADYYEKNQEKFRAPEYRGFTALVLTLDTAAKDITVTDERLHEEYQNRASEFETPEKRQIEQIVVATKEKAEAAEKELADGKDFLAVAKDVAGLEPDAVKLGLVARSEMPAEIANAAFSAEEGKVTEPVQSPFGWHVLRVTEIQPAHTETFEEAAPRLKAQVTRDMAADQLFKLSNDVEDAFAGGASLDDVAAKFNIPKTEIASTDPSGKTPNGEAIALPAGGQQILRAAFSTPEGQVSRMAETGDGAYYVLRVDKIVPSTIRPIAEVRDTILQDWKTEKQTASVEAKAKALADAVNGGKSLADLAGEQNLKLVTTEPFLRTGAGANGLPSTLVSALFGAQRGAAITSPGIGGSYVAQLKSIDAPSADDASPAVAQLSSQIQAGIRDDIGSELEHSLRQRYGVTIRSDEIARLF
jgi:peptidyl-prolyl cis-trans isomerase D